MHLFFYSCRPFDTCTDGQTASATLTASEPEDQSAVHRVPVLQQDLVASSEPSHWCQAATEYDTSSQSSGTHSKQQQQHTQNLIVLTQEETDTCVGDTGELPTIDDDDATFERTTSQEDNNTESEFELNSDTSQDSDITSLSSQRHSMAE